MKKYLFLLFLLLSSPCFGATITFNTTDGFTNVSANWVGGANPTSVDNVIFNSTSGNATLVSTLSCKSINFTGYTGNFTHNSTGNLDVYNGNLTFVTGMNYIKNGNSIIQARGSLTSNYTFAGKSVGGFTVNSAGGTVVLIDSLNTSLTNQTVTLTAGTLLTDGASSNSNLTHTWGSFSSSNTNVRTLQLGNSTINVTGTGTAWTAATSTNLTLNSNTSTINFLGASVRMEGGTLKVYNNINFLGSGSPVMRDTIPIVSNLTRIGTAVTTDGFLLRSTTNDNNITGVLTLYGNSNKNRLLVSYYTGLGTQANVTAMDTNVSNVDFRDIQFTSPIDLSNNSSGDCGGNTNITFTPPADQTATMSTNQNWSNVSIWTSRVPLPQDNVSMANVTGGTLTADMPRLGKTIDWTGATGSPTFTLGNAVTNYGGLTLIGGMTFNGAFGWTFEGRGSFGLTSGGKPLPSSATIQMINGSLTLNDAWSSVGNGYTLNNGIFNCNDFNLTVGTFRLDSASNHTFISGNGNITLTTSGSSWDANPSTNLNFTSNGSTIILSSTSAATPKTFDGGNLSYWNILFSGGSTKAFVVVGNNTFNEFNISKTNSPFFNMTSGDTQSINQFVAQGDPTHIITINSTIASSPAYLNDLNGGRNTLTYCNLTDITANVTTAKWWAFNDTNTHLRTSGFLTNNPTVGFSNVKVQKQSLN